MSGTMLTRQLKILAPFFVATAASAAEPGALREAPPILASSEWVFQVTPYGWAAGMKGDVSPFRLAPTIRVEKPFSEILGDLNIGAFINFYARKDRFVFSADAMYVNLTESAVAGPLPVVGAIRGRYNTSQFAATLQGGYRVYAAPQFTFDLLAGARIWRLTNDLRVTAAGRTVGFSNNFGWADPVIGVRAFYRFNERFTFLAQGDIGGFGVGSDFTWQALATLNYSLNDRFAVSAGYKWLSVDYSRGGRVFDTNLFGPVLGVTYRF